MYRIISLRTWYSSHVDRYSMLALLAPPYTSWPLEAATALSIVSNLSASSCTKASSSSKLKICLLIECVLHTYWLFDKYIPWYLVSLSCLVMAKGLHHHTHGPTALGEKVGNVVTDLGKKWKMWERASCATESSCAYLQLLHYRAALCAWSELVVPGKLCSPRSAGLGGRGREGPPPPLLQGPEAAWLRSQTPQLRTGCWEECTGTPGPTVWGHRVTSG